MNHSPAPDGTQLEAEVAALLEHLWQDDVLSDPSIERIARELLLDTLGATISGLQDPVIRGLLDQLSAAEPGHIPFPGSDRRLSASMFLLAYSAAVCHYEAGEGLPVSHGRPGLHAIGVLLAHALGGSRTLRDVLSALVVAYETGGRLGAMLRIKPGMHVDGSWGSFAAATALAHLQGLTGAQALAALNHVACQVPFSLYYPITMGSIARNFFIGHGAILGAFAVQAARGDYGGPAGSIAQYARLALGHEDARLPARLPPETRVLRQGYLKPYPCTRHMHYGIEAAVAWVARNGPLTAPPERITLRVYAEAMQYCPNRRPVSHIQAQFSLTYGLAYALMHGGFTPQAYRPEWIGNEGLRRIEDRIMVEDFPELSTTGKRGCVLEIVRDGKVEQIRIASVVGDPGRQMASADVLRKFLGLAGPVLGMDRAQQLAEEILAGKLDDRLALAGAVPGESRADGAS